MSLRKCLLSCSFDQSHHVRLDVTLTDDLLTSTSNQFISILNCTEIVNLVKFLRAVFKLSS